MIKVYDSRHYSIDDRAGLRNISSSEWQSCYEKYLRDLACPIVSDNDGNSDNADYNVIKDDEDEEEEMEEWRVCRSLIVTISRCPGARLRCWTGCWGAPSDSSTVSLGQQLQLMCCELLQLQLILVSCPPQNFHLVSFLS